jgi:cytochrome P450
MSNGCPVTDYNHLTDPRMAAAPHAEWDRLKAEYGRAFRSDAGPYPIWFLLDGADIRKAFQTPEVFSSRVVMPFEAGDEHTWIPEEVDPPDHQKYRKILNEWFAPARIAAVEPDIRAWCIQLLEGLTDRDEIEFVSEFSSQFPGGFFLQYIGLPADMANTFLGWMADIVEFMFINTAETEASDAKKRTANLPVIEYLSTVFEDRRREPADDFFTYLLNAQVEDRKLTDEELLNIAILLYMAGLDTVSSMLAFFFKHLADHPEHRQQLIDDPAIIPSATEELLRYYASTNTGRIVTRDIEFAGCPMKEGDRVVLSAVAANHDETEFERAQEIMFDREQNPHLTFAAGPHRCPGSHLARAELVIALEEWHKRIPHYSVADPSQVSYRGGGQMGVDCLPLRLGT